MAATAPVTWTELSAAIAANPFRSKGCGLTATTGSASASLTIRSMPVAETIGLPWLGAADLGWTEETTFAAADVLSFVLWVQDPLYRAAEAGVRLSMEQEVATTLLNGVEASWRRHHGKSRGWVRKHLEEDLRARSAGAPATDGFWAASRTQRRVAHLVDYVAVVRGLRLGLWSPIGKTVTMIPMSGLETTVGVAQLNMETGRPLLTPTGVPLLQPATAWPALVESAKAGGIHWTPPACVASGGAMTVAQIQERLSLVVGAAAAAKKTGSRAALWATLHWEMLVQHLAGKSDDTVIAMALLSDDSTGSGKE